MVRSAVVALGLVASMLSLAGPGHAAGSGCASQAWLEERVLVKKRPVTTVEGHRFGTLRLFGGVEDTEVSPGGAGGGYVPSFCLDLVLAERFEDKTPKIHGRVSMNDGLAVWYVSGRARTAMIAGGSSGGLEGSRLRTTLVVDGHVIHARRVMTAIFPEVG